MKKNNMNNQSERCIPGKPKYKLGDEVAFRFDRGHGKYLDCKGTIEIVDSFGSLEFYNEQPSYDIWVADENGEGVLYKHVPEIDIEGEINTI